MPSDHLAQGEPEARLLNLPRLQDPPHNQVQVPPKQGAGSVCEARTADPNPGPAHHREGPGWASAGPTLPLPQAEHEWAAGRKAASGHCALGSASLPHLPPLASGSPPDFLNITARAGRHPQPTPHPGVRLRLLCPPRGTSVPRPHHRAGPTWSREPPGPRVTSCH